MERILQYLSEVVIINLGMYTIGKNTILSDNVILVFPLSENMSKEEFPGTTFTVDGVLRSGTTINSGVVIGKNFSTGHNVMIREKTTIGYDRDTSSSIIVFPAHLRTVKYLTDYGHLLVNICLPKLLAYLDMLHLMKYTKIIIIESGGVRKEAYVLKVPCITLRKKTEWVETPEDGRDVLFGANFTKIIDAVREISSVRMKLPGTFDKRDAAEMVLSVISSINNQKDYS